MDSFSPPTVNGRQMQASPPAKGYTTVFLCPAEIACLVQWSNAGHGGTCALSIASPRRAQEADDAFPVGLVQCLLHLARFRITQVGREGTFQSLRSQRFRSEGGLRVGAEEDAKAFVIQGVHDRHLPHSVQYRCWNDAECVGTAMST